MRSGEELHGSIENQDRERVIIRIDGDLRVVPKSTLKRIIYHQDDARAVELALLAEQEAERKAAEAEAQRKAAEEAEKRRLAEEQAERERQAAERSRREAEEQRRRAEQAEAERRSREEQARQADERRRAAEERAERENSGRQWSALWRSALIPGWGQAYNDQPVKAGVIGLSFVAGAYGLYTTNQDYREALDVLAEMNNPFTTGNILSALTGTSTLPTDAQLADPIYMYIYSQDFAAQRASADGHYDKMQAAGAFMAFVYVYNLIDAFWSGSINDSDATARAGELHWRPFFELESPDKHAGWFATQTQGRSGLRLQWSF